MKLKRAFFWALLFCCLLSPVSGQQFLYNYGTENFAWQAGSSAGTGGQNKEPDHLYLYATQNGARRTYVTTNQVNLTNVDYIHVKWLNEGGNDTDVRSYIVASTDQNGAQTVFNRRYERQRGFGMRTDVLDVSGLTGNHYIRLHANRNAAGGDSFLRVYQVWIPGPLAPGQVKLKTTAAGNQISWVDGGNNGSTTLIRYNIGRSNVRGGPYTPIGNTTSLSWTDTTAAPGAVYYYVVNDQNSMYTTSWSGEVIGFHPLAGATKDCQIYKNEQVVRARWPIYENEIVKTFVGLSTVKGEANIVDFIDVGHATEHTFAGVSLQPGQDYYVTVKVQDTTGNLNGYGTSACSSNGFRLIPERDLIDVASSTYFNNALSRVMTEVNPAGSVYSTPFADGVLRRYRAPLTLTERGIESRINAPVEITVGGTGFAGNLAGAQQQLRIADEWGNEVPCKVFAYAAGQCTATIIANLPKNSSKTYWAFWGAGSTNYFEPGFVSSTNETSQREWTRYYSRKLLPAGIEGDALSSWTRLTVTVGDWYDRGGTWVTLPWAFPYFAETRTNWYVGIKGILTGEAHTAGGYTQYTNTWTDFIETDANRSMISALWQDTSVRETDTQPQNIGFYTLQKSLGDPDARQGFYWRANRYGLLDNIYQFQTFLYQYGDIAHRYDYLSYDGLWTKEAYDNPVNVPPHHTVGISANNGTDYLWSTPLIEGNTMTPTSFFQYKNAVSVTLGTVEDASAIPGGTTWRWGGHFDSHVFDSRISTPEWQRIYYEVTAGGGRVHFYVRTGSTPEPDGSWTSWGLVAQNVTGNGDQSLLTQEKQRYIQYRCVFIKDAAGDNPVLNRVEFRCRGFEIVSVVADTPEGVTQGQENIPVTVTVKNYDPLNPVSVATITPLLSLGSYTYTLVSPVSMPHSIAAGGQADFIFSVNVAEDSPIGTSTLDAVATATIGAQTFSDNGADVIDTWEVRKKAELEIEQVDATPLTVNKGQTVRVRMMIKNSGGTPFYFDDADLSISTGYDITLNEPLPNTLVGPGETMIATFTVFIKTDCDSGPVTLDGSASGRNKLSNKLVSDTAAQITDSWTVQNPASLVIESVIASDTVYRGQSAIPVFLKVINMGEALAYWDSSEVLLSFGTYDAKVPHSLFPIDVYGGLSQIAEYWVSVAADSATGTSDVDASVKFRDGNTSDDFEIFNALFPTQWLIIGEKVKIFKDSALLFESASFNLPSAGVVDVFCRAEDLAPLKEYTIRWYKPDGSEFAVTAPPKTSDASGTISHQIAIDNNPANMGNWRVKVTNPLNTHIACENIFQIVSPANPSIIVSLPAKVSVGQQFNASATIINNGGALFKTAYPGTLLKGGAGGDATFIVGPVPALQDVSGNGVATFSYQLQADTAGTFTLRGTVYGYDGNSDAFLTAATHTSNICTIQTPPNLSVVSITEAYNNVYCNQQNLTVTMRIRNNGQADAVVEAASLTFSLGTHNQKINPPATFPFVLAGGGATVDMVFTVDVAIDSAAGNVAVGGSFRAYDANNPVSIFGITGGAGAWTIQAVAGICAAVSSYNPEQYAFNVGQTVYARFINLPLNTQYRVRFYNNSPTGGARVFTSPTLNSGAYGICDSSYILDPGLGSTLRQRWRVSIDVGGTYDTEGTLVGYQYFDVQNPGNLQTGLTLSPTSLFVGETFSATLVATNTQTAGSTIASTTPAELQKTAASTGNAVKIQGPLPAIASIPPALPGVFNWTFEATADTTTVGSFSMTAQLANSAAGFDANTGAAVNSNKALSNSIFIYRRGITIGSATIDFGTILPGDTGSILYFDVVNSGNYPLSNVKWTLADMKNQWNDYISKANLAIDPSNFSIPVSDEIVANGLLAIPYNQASGTYAAAMSVYEDLNGNSNRDFTEPVSLFSVKAVVPSAKKIVISDQFIDLDNWSQGQTTVVKKVNFFNGGNLDLVNLKVSPPLGSATFITVLPLNPGLLPIGDLSHLDVSATVPGPQPNGVYIATFTIYDDEDGDGLTPSDARSEFAVKIGVGNKSFTISPATLNAGNATPSFVVENLPFQINNTGILGLTALKPLAGVMINGANEIASNQIAIFLPATVAAGGAPGDSRLSIYIPMGTPAGAYLGKMWVYEDNNGNSVYDNGEASASFNLTANVPSYSAVQVIPSTVDLGDVAAGTGISTTFLCRNIGNVALNKLHWQKINLTSGASTIPMGAYSFPGGEPFAVPAGELFTREISINVPGGQPDGSYVGNLSWLFEDNVVINASRDVNEPQSGFRVACRVGNLQLQVIEPGGGIVSNGDPNALSAVSNFSVKNTGTLTIARPKATATALIGPDTIPAAANVFAPAAIGYIVQDQSQPVSWRVQVPANTSAGAYTGTVTMWNDSNNDGLINPGEAFDTAPVTLTVNSKRVIEVMSKPLNMPLTTENSSVNASFEVRNRGNISLDSLRGLTAAITTISGESIPAASITLAIPAGSVPAGGSVLVTATVVVGPQLPGNYRGTMRIYDDYLLPSGSYTTEESDTFELRLTIGRKTFTVTSPVNFPAANPGQTVNSTPVTVITNTSGLPLSKLRWKAADLVSGTNSIASTSISFLPAPPVSVPVSGFTNFSATVQVLPHIPSTHVPPGLYTGTQLIWEDDNGDGLMHPTGEASATFLLRLTVSSVSALDVETDPVELGDVVQGAGSAKVPVTVKNTGNVALNTFTWSFTNLTNGIDFLPGSSLLKTDPMPASLLPGQTTTFDVWLDPVPDSQPIGPYESDFLNRSRLAASGFSEDFVTFKCNVLPGGPPPAQIAKHSIYQEVDPALFAAPVPPQTDLYFLSAWVCPGSGSADLAFIQYDAAGTALATISATIKADGSLSVIDPHASFKAVYSGICETEPIDLTLPDSSVESSRYFRVFFAFNLVEDVPDIGADSLRIILHNSSPMVGQAVWFDGIKLERAFDGQTRPTTWHPGATLFSPREERSLSGDHQYYEW